MTLLRILPAPQTPGAARAARRLRVVPALLAAAVAAAACGGDGGTAPGAQTSVRLDVAAQTALAAGTTGATVRIVPSYERASGDRVPLAAQTAALSGGATQTLPFTFDLAPCFNDAARRGADQGTGANAVCVIGAAVTLQAGNRTLDSAAVGPFTVRGGAATSVSVSFVEVASVRVTRAGGAAIGATPVPLQLGQTLALAGAAVDQGGATLARAVGWTSSAPSIATVDAATGVVTPVGFGTARVTAAAGGREATVDVVVQPTVAVTLAGGGGGSVASAPAGITCATAGAAGCTAAFAPGASVTLTATPDANSVFTGWSGACTGTGTCTVALTEARAVTATFGRRPLTVTVNVSGPGAGSVLVTGTGVTNGTCTLAAGTSERSCAVGAEAGRTITLNAQPATGNGAGTWTGACTGPATQACSITPTADATVGVNFTTSAQSAVDSVKVSVLSPDGTALEGNLGVEGTLNGRAIGSQFTINLQTSAAQPAFTFVVDRGTPVTLRFAPTSPARMDSWGGLCAGTAVSTTGISACTFTAQPQSPVSITLRP